MKRTTILLCALLLAAPLLPKHAAPTAEKEVLRLHILANSDSPADQAAKLQVRDALLPLFAAAKTYSDARAFVLDHGAALLQVCEATLSSAGAAYGAQLLLGVSDFPDRTYGGVPFPAGPYDALQIVLGAGAGHNWWCVLFPPLCIVTPADTASPTAVPLSDTSLAPVTFQSDLLAFLRRCFGKQANG